MLRRDSSPFALQQGRAHADRRATPDGDSLQGPHGVDALFVPGRRLINHQPGRALTMPSASRRLLPAGVVLQPRCDLVNGLAACLVRGGLHRLGVVAFCVVPAAHHDLGRVNPAVPSCAAWLRCRWPAPGDE